MPGGAERAHEESTIDAGDRVALRPALVLFAVALALRIAALWLLPAPEPNYNYWLARGLVTLHAFALGPEPTSFIEPLYPAFLALGMSVFDSDRLVLFLQALVSASGAPAMFLLGWRLTGLRIGGLWAGLLYAADPYFVRQAHSYIELPFLLPLLLWTLERLVAAQRTGQAVVGGLLTGLVLLTRTALLPTLVGTLIVMYMRRGKLALVSLAAAALVVSPWAWRSLTQNGSPVPTRAGENLFVSTSPYAVGVLPRYDADLLIRFAWLQLDADMPATADGREEGIADRLLARRALEFALAHPGQAAMLKLKNAAWIFAPVLVPRNAKSPYTHAAMVNGRMELTGLAWRPLGWELAHGIFRTLVLVAAMIGFWRRRQIDDQWLLVVLGAELAVHVVFFPTTRLLAPFTAMLMLYAGYGFALVETLARASHSLPAEAGSHT